MERRTLEQISDGKLYDIDDKVAAGTGGCNSCSACCHLVGDLVVLTPFDIYEITQYMNQSFDQLLDHHIVLREENKVSLPYLKMQGPTERCSFLNDEDRCSIHQARPNICRLFPLGRVYQQNTFKYFLQVGSCPKPHLTQVQIREWIGIDNYEQNKRFILEWHQFIKALTFRLKFVREESEQRKINDVVINTFYRIKLIKGEDFYSTFFNLLPETKDKLGIL